MKHKIKAAIEHGLKAAMSHMGHDVEAMDSMPESAVKEGMQSDQEGKMPMPGEISQQVDHKPPGDYSGKGMMSKEGMDHKKKFAVMSLKKKFNL